MTGPGDAAQDRSLVAAAAEGDRSAFGELVAGHLELLWAVAAQLVGEPVAAETALQAGVTAAYRDLPRARGEADVRLWLVRHVVEAAGPAQAPVPREPLRAALAGLPLELRAAVVLVDVLALPPQDAARALGVPTDTTLRRCARGRAQLGVTLGLLRNRTDPPPVIPEGTPEGPGGAR